MMFIQDQETFEPEKLRHFGDTKSTSRKHIATSSVYLIFIDICCSVFYCSISNFQFQLICKLCGQVLLLGILHSFKISRDERFNNHNCRGACYPLLHMY